MGNPLDTQTWTFPTDPRTHAKTSSFVLLTGIENGLSDELVGPGAFDA